MKHCRYGTSVIYSLWDGGIPFLNNILPSALNAFFLFPMCCLHGSTVFAQAPALFGTEEPLELTLHADLKNLFRDRGDESPYHPASVTYQDSGETVHIPLRAKTRGHFRKIAANCKYPPILLNFDSIHTPGHSIFYGQDKLKLVTPCRGDEYLVYEYLVYKVYNLVTPKSFMARLVKVVYRESVKGKASDPYYGILLEDEDQMARRNGANSIKAQGLRPENTQKEDFLKMAVFQYMIGNTDWSIQFRQNIKLIAPPKSLPSAVPYDFDHAGIVQAPYANPAPELRMQSTRHRRYRGNCIPDMNEFTPVIDQFNQLKEAIYSVYGNNPLLSESYRSQTVNFLDKFYETINDPEDVVKAFSYPCDRSGTGNVVIQGLKKND